MKQFKKILICLLSVALLCGSQLVSVNAAEAVSAGNETGLMPLKVVQQEATVNGVTVVFHFDYSDGNSAKLVAAICTTAGYEMPNPPSSHFAGDTCYATATVVNSTTHVQVTLKAWCDIYGQTGTN